MRSKTAPLVFGLALFLFCASGQNTLTVPDEYPTIQASIDAAQPGDTVFIRAGTYRENLTITKPLQLVGEDRLTVWIEAADPDGPVLRVDLAMGQVLIRGLTVRGGKVGLELRVALGARAKIEQVRVVSNKCGIFAAGSGMVQVYDSILADNEYGVFTDAAVTELVSVEISRGTVGIILAGTGKTVIQGCLVGLAQYAIVTYTTACGWSSGARVFGGTVEGEGNRVFGLRSDFCPAYPGKPWPKTFVDEIWYQTVREAAADFNRGGEAYQAGDYQGAVRTCKQGLAKMRNAPFPVLEAYFHRNLGVVFRALGLYEGALAEYEEARAVFVARGMTVEIAKTDVNMGVVYDVRGKYEEALQKYEAARAVFAAYGMDEDVAFVDENMGGTYRKIGRYENALRKYEEARAVYVALRMTVKVADVDVNMGHVFYDLGQYEEALLKYAAAREVYLAQGITVNVAKVDHNIGNIYTALGRYEEALLKYAAAREVYLAQGLTVNLADVDVNIGNVYQDLGRYEEALLKYAAAREVYLAQGMTVKVATVDMNIGNVYQELGRYEEALSRYGAAREVYLAQGMTVRVADIDHNIGIVYTVLGWYKEALLKHAAAREVYLAQGLTVNVARVDTDMGTAYAKLGQYEEALLKYAAAREVYLAQGMTVEVAIVDMNMGNVYQELGRYEEALTKYKEALEGLDRIPPLPGMAYSYPAERWMIHNNRGIALERLERYEEAISAYQEALGVIESIRGFLRTEGFKAAWGERTRDVYEQLIDLLYRLGQGVQAFPYTERCRARTFLDLLYQGGVKPEQFLGPEQGVVAGAVDPQAIDRAIDKALTLLGPREAVFSYFVTERGVYLWVITQAGIGEPLFLPYPRKELMRDVLATRLLLEKAEPALDLDKHLEALYARLVAPGLARLPPNVETLILIPSGPLWYVPFAALPMRDRPLVVQGLARRPPYLVEAYTLAYLPSLASLASLAQKREIPPTYAVLGLANPVTVVEGPCAEAARYVNLERAAQDFADRYASGRAEVYLGAQATEPRAYRPAGHEVVLYACHGMFNPAAPLASKLLLAPEREPYAPGDPRVPDGNYHAWEVLFTDHTGVDLVVLGACETLLPAFRNLQGALAVLSGEACERVELKPEQLEQITSGDEVVGLVRAFLSTGAQSVLATLWQANPAAVGALLVKLAEHRLAGKSWAQALACAQRELLRSEAFAHPWFWAPYQLVGRWR